MVKQTHHPTAHNSNPLSALLSTCLSLGRSVSSQTRLMSVCCILVTAAIHPPPPFRPGALKRCRMSNTWSDSACRGLLGPASKWDEALVRVLGEAPRTRATGLRVCRLQGHHFPRFPPLASTPALSNLSGVLEWLIYGWIERNVGRREIPTSEDERCFLFSSYSKAVLV